MTETFGCSKSRDGPLDFPTLNAQLFPNVLVCELSTRKQLTQEQKKKEKERVCKKERLRLRCLFV